MIERWRALPPYPRRVVVRLACAPFLWMAGTIAVFVVLRVLADAPEPAIQGVDGTEEQIEALRKALGLDRSYFEQYIDWLTALLRGDFGTDVYTQRSIRTQIWNRAEPTVSALFIGLGFSAVIAGGFAFVSRSGPALRTGSRTALALLASLPIATVAIAYLVLPARWWNHAPPVGSDPSFLGDFSDFLLLVVLPAIACGAIAAGFTGAAVARGLDASSSHRTGMLRAVGTSICGSLPIIISCLIVVERVLSITGLGEFLIRALIFRDFNLVMALFAILLTACLTAWTLHPEEALPSRVPAESPPRPLMWLVIPAMCLVVAFLVVALVGPLFTEDVRAISRVTVLLPPSLDHPFGTDRFGRDQLELTIAGLRTALKYALVTVALGVLPGLVVVVGASKLGRLLQVLLQEVAALWQALPLLPTLLLFSLSFDASFWHILIPLVVTASAVTVLLVRADEALDLSRGDDRREILLSLCASASLAAAMAITAEFTLSFLGVGRYDDISLGYLVSQSQSAAITHMYLWLIPSFVLTAVLLSFMLLRRSLDGNVPPQMYER